MAAEAEENASRKHGHFGRFLRHRGFLILVLCLIGVAAYALIKTEESRHRKAAQQRKAAPPAIPVVAVPAQKTDFNIYITGLGSVTPIKTVAVHTRVDGQLMEVLFREGQIVENGELLARLDPRPFEVQLTQAEGQMARDVAQLENAQLDLERYELLWNQDSIPKQQLDTQAALVRQLKGVVKADQGAIDSARLNLAYCRITAPLRGRAGLRLIDPGNIVHAADVNGLVVITQLQPISVIFPISEDSLPAVLDRLGRGERLPVDVYDREMRRILDRGSLLTVDSQIDPTTGTVRLKAILPNKENKLFPNQFVNARLLVNVRRGATVVPAAAIQRGPSGTFTYVVKPDQSVEVRPTTVGETEAGQASIKAGLSPGELVVVDGADRLHEGARIQLRASPPKSGPSSGGY